MIDEAKAFDANCVLAQDGQLQISNPTTFGMCNSSSVTIKLTPVAR